MAQGAATSMEDGAFLAAVLGQVIRGKFTVAEAIELYERERMPQAYAKQQVSFLNGIIWQLPEGPEQHERDEAMAPEVNGEQFLRSSNLYGDPTTVLEVYGYDVEEHARIAIAEHLEKRTLADKQTGVTKAMQNKYMWFRSKKHGPRL